jgi:hypothetical protein
MCVSISEWNTDSFLIIIQAGSNMTGTNCDLFTHNQSLSYLNHLVRYRGKKGFEDFSGLKYS